MNLNIYITFIFATSLILIIPGPTIIMVLSQAINHGRKSVIPLVLGVVVGDLTAMTLSLLGLGALLSTSAILFSFFKWIGALYLIYLGIKLWKSKPIDRSEQYKTVKTTNFTLFKSSFIVTVFNPKSIAFFVAFFPQFINPIKPVQIQLTLLGGTFLTLAVINATLYALFASQLGERMKKPNIQKWFNRFSGSALIGAGIFTAAIQKNS